MVKDLSIWKIKIVSLRYNDDSSLSVRFNPSDESKTLVITGFYEEIRCKAELLYMLELYNGINVNINSSQFKEVKKDVQCFIIYDLDGNYMAIADLDLTKFFLLDSGVICSEKEFMQAVKAKKRQQLYDLLASYIDGNRKMQNELMELEEISLNFHEK